MEKVDVVIIGAGVVGLSIASEVAGKNRNVILIERHDSFGEETSSRNSEIIHSGIYYSPGSLKAGLCVEGNKLLHETIDYGMDESNKEFCYESVRRFLPFLELQDLEPDMTGIQPKVQKQGEQEKNFIIVHEEEKGFPGLINLIGIESPTSKNPAFCRSNNKTR